MHYSVSELSIAIGARQVGNSQHAITHVTIDSRSVTTGLGVAFFAIVGERFDGHRFISELYTNSGVPFFVVSSKVETEKYADATFLVVANTLMALQKLAAYHRAKFGYPVIGITGSNGKTIVKEWLSQLLSPERRLVRSPKSFNSQVGVPLSVLQMDSEYDMGIFEAGISKPNEMKNLEPIVKPSIGIITNIGSAHQENFSNMNLKCAEKMYLFSNVKVLIYCTDHKIIDFQSQALIKNGTELFTWGTAEHSSVKLLAKEIQSLTTFFEIEYSGKRNKLSIPFADSASFENAMHCIALMLYLNFSIDEIAIRVKQLQPVAMRLELKEGRNGCTIINDTYNSDLGSLTVALDFMGQMAHSTKRILILSDILQSGRYPLDLYTEVGKLIKQK